MPVYLKEVDNFRELEHFNSVLIVPCRFCPAASIAVGKNKPYFRFLRNFLKTEPYEHYIETMQSELEEKGVRVDVFKSRLPHQFVVCMWTVRRRKKLMKLAMKYEALVVLGCEAAVRTICDSLEPGTCKVFQGMRSEGIMSIQPRFQLPCSISLTLNSLTPLVHRRQKADPWVQL